MAAASRSELAARFGVSVQRVYAWCRQPGFPASVGFEPTGRRQKGRPAELWDDDDVAAWLAREQEAPTGHRAVEARWARARAEARRLRAEGMAVLDIAPAVGMSVSAVRRITADVPATPTRSLRPHPWHYPDAQMFASIRASGATTGYGYSKWRRAQSDPHPSVPAILKRYGSWQAAFDAAQQAG